MPKAKELYLYTDVSNYSAKDIISQMEENSGNDMVIRVNSPGGDVFAGWGIIAKMKEAEGNILIKVDGWAASMSAFMLLFADDVEALETSKFILHRADGYVGNAEDQAFLDDVNKDLKNKMAKKLNFDKLKELKNVGIEDIFDPKTHIDVVLNAKEAKQIGLVNRTTKLSVTEIAAMHNRFNIAAHSQINPTLNNDIMNLAELKEKHPALYAEVVKIGNDAGVTSGVSKERARVLTHVAFADVDLKKVIEGITKGEELSAEAQNEFATTRITNTVLAKIEKNNPGAVTVSKVSEEAKTAKAKEVDAFYAETMKNMGIKEESTTK